MAQRLLRRTCQTCKGSGKGSTTGIYAGRCEKCLGTGYYGRIAVYEIMTMNDELRKRTAQNADAVTIAEIARRHGMRTMIDDARDKVGMGLTDEREIARVLS